jgi:hypothetical protein
MLVVLAEDLARAGGGRARPDARAHRASLRRSVRASKGSARPEQTHALEHRKSAVTVDVSVTRSSRKSASGSHDGAYRAR